MFKKGSDTQLLCNKAFKSFGLLLTLLSLGVRRVFEPAGAIGVFNTLTKMDSNQEDKFADSTDRLLKLRRNPNKMEVLRRLQCHFFYKEDIASG